MKIFNKFYYFVYKKHKWTLSKIEYPQIHVKNTYFCFMSYSNQNFIVCANAFRAITNIYRRFDIDLNSVFLDYKSYVQSLQKNQ